MCFDVLFLVNMRQVRLPVGTIMYEYMHVIRIERSNEV